MLVGSGGGDGEQLVTVKLTLTEYKQAHSFFSTPAEGVPTASIIAEFGLVNREWERRVLMQRFSLAFKSGMLL